MTHPSRIRAAHDAPDKWARVGLLADTMVEREAASGACTYEDLRAKGLSSAEIAAYRDPALELISERPFLFGTARDGLMKGVALVFRAREIRRRADQPVWAPPRVVPTPWRKPFVAEINHGARAS